MDAYRGKPFRSLVLDTFDRLSAPVEHRYVWKDLAPWFSETGLVVDAARDETGWFVLAHKPNPEWRGRRSDVDRNGTAHHGGGPHPQRP